jgi:hypothetical protein
MMSFPSALLSICRVQVNLIKTVLLAALSLADAFALALCLLEILLSYVDIFNYYLDGTQE